MSSIIDALTKSDANRPKKNNGLKIPMNLKSQSQKKHRWFLYLSLLVLLPLLAAVYFQKPSFLWQNFNHSVATNDQQKLETAVVTDTLDAPTATKVGNKKLAKPTPKQVQSVAIDQQAKASQTEQSITPTEPSTAGKKATVTHQQVAADKDEQQRTQNQPLTEQESITSELVGQEIDQQLDVTPMKNKQAIKTPSAERQNKAVTTASLPQFFELPFNIRKEIPKLNLSVHIYDPQVANRMAIINGIPVHVGDTLEDLLNIQDITQDGVVFRIQNRDFIVLK